jgi:hypothetical protein
MGQALVEAVTPKAASDSAAAGHNRRRLILVAAGVAALTAGGIAVAVSTLGGQQRNPNAAVCSKLEATGYTFAGQEENLARAAAKATNPLKLSAFDRKVAGVERSGAQAYRSDVAGSSNPSLVTAVDRLSNLLDHEAALVAAGNATQGVAALQQATSDSRPIAQICGVGSVPTGTLPGGS